MDVGSDLVQLTADGGPATMVDFNGVPGGPGYRAIQVRYTYPVSKELSVSSSIEDDPISYRSRPLLTGALRYTASDSIYQFTAASRGMEDLAGNDVSGWGASASVVLTPWEGGSFSGVFAAGKGMSSLLSGDIGQQAGQPAWQSGYDIDANGDAIGMISYGFGISHAITPKFEVGFAYGRNDYDNFAGSSAQSIEHLSAAILTARYKPAENVLLAVEYSRLERGEFGGGKVENDRIATIAQFSF